VAPFSAMLTTLVTYLFDWALARALGVRRVRLALALPLAAWVALLALAPRAVGGFLGELITTVQPR
jgi:hypothetical protein